MELNGFTLPEALSAELKAGRSRLTVDQKQRLAAMLTQIERPFPELYDIDGISGANRLWASEQAQFYIGTESDSYRPGNVDARKTLIIGQAEPDSPIALDYRLTPPSVIYLGTVAHESHWIKLCENYETLVAQLNQPTPDSEQ